MTPRALPLPPEERRAGIIAAARPLLLEHGGHFTTRQVAEAAGIAEGTLFRVFATKRDLMHAVITDAMDPTAVCDDLDAIDRDLPLTERVTRTIERMQRSVDEVTAIFSALMSMPSEDGDHFGHKGDHADPAARERREAQTARLHASLTGVLSPDADRLACTVDEAASLLQSIALATSHPHFGHHRLSDPRRLASLLLGGIAPTTTREETSC